MTFYRIINRNVCKQVFLITFDCTHVINEHGLGICIATVPKTKQFRAPFSKF